MKRFYKTVAVGDDYSILLDGKPIKTPAGATLVLPTPSLAAAVAEEWRGQGDKIEPATMPLTKLANTAIDRAGALRCEIETELVGFGKTDLICYLATEPDALIARQRAAWSPLHDWVRETHGVRLKTGHGIGHVAQDEAALAALAHALGAQDDWTLTALQTLTTITGSLVLALAVADDRLTAAEAFALSRVDETFQAEKWGLDADAEKRARLLANEAAKAAEFIALARA